MATTLWVPPSQPKSVTPEIRPDAEVIRKTVAMMKRAERPIIYGGVELLILDQKHLAFATVGGYDWMANNPDLDGAGGVACIKQAFPWHAWYARHL